MRLFIGVRTPNSINIVLNNVERPSINGLRWLTEDKWHVTLVFLGSVEDTFVPRLANALSEIKFRRFTATLGPNLEILNRRIACVPVSGFNDLAGEVRNAIAGIVDSPTDHEFFGHITIGRMKGSAVLHSGDVKLLKNVQVHANWSVDNFELIQSHISNSGAVYETISGFLLKD